MHYSTNHCSSLHCIAVLYDAVQGVAMACVCCKGAVRQMWQSVGVQQTMQEGLIGCVSDQGAAQQQTV